MKLECSVEELKLLSKAFVVKETTKIKIKEPVEFRSTSSGVSINKEGINLLMQ